VFGFAIERLIHHPGLSFLALLGVVLTVGLVTNASFFSQAVDKVILLQELDAFSGITGRPPFSTSLYTFVKGDAPISLQQAEDLSDDLVAAVTSEVGLPLQHLDLQVHGGNMMLRPRQGGSDFGGEDQYLGSVDLAYATDISEQMTILEGSPLDADGASQGEVLDVWMHTRLAEKMGINAGEELEFGPNMTAESTTIRVVGIWKARDPADLYWFESPDATLQNVLLVRRQDYIDHVQPQIASKTWYLSWHIILDDSDIVPENAQAYLTGFTRAEAIILKYLPGVRINTPPLDPLASFVSRGNTLTVLLLAFNLPALGFLLYFLVLSSTIIAQWQQRETATLVSRGMRARSILVLTLVEELILFVVGYPIGVAVGAVLALAMGNTSSFLSFTSRPALPISFRGLNIPLTLMALLVTLLARLIPAVRSARLSAIEVDRERARPVRPPFWYRAYLDVILLVPTFYAYQQLQRQGSLSMLVKDRPEDLYQDPLLVLLPALFILAISLISLRLFPLIMRGLDLIANVIPWTTPHLALRQLSRSSLTYINPLLLVITSLALGVYTLSMAASLDQWLVDRMHYSVGTDLSFKVWPVTTDDEVLRSSTLTGEWVPLPANFADVPGIEAATRVGSYRMTVELMGRGNISGRFMAIDRWDFPRVAWFRDDFAQESLGALMNQMAQYQDAVLVSREVMEQNNLAIGDTVVIRVGINYELYVEKPFTIAGVYEYFPTVYEDDQMTFIGNLDDLTFSVGMTVPHDIWARMEPRSTGEDVAKALPVTLRIQSSNAAETAKLVAKEQAKHERVGVFGTLSVGFLSAVVMAIMGLLIYTYASLQERLHRFTILRAVGLQRSQISVQVILEYLFLTAYGAVAGALVGSAASNLFVPFFRITGEKGVPLPPLIPIIAADKVRWLVLAFVAVIVLMEVAVIARALSRRAYVLLRGVWG